MENNNIKISVIMPVYNVSEYLKETLDCVLSQSFRDFELIIIDDKSTDNTLQIAKTYAEKDNRIKVIPLPKNKKQGYARNLGIENARGEYISFIDGDDIPDEQFLEKLYSSITANNTDIAMCKFRTLDDKNGRISDSHVFGSLKDAENLNNFFSAYDIKNQFFTIPHVVWNKIYRKSFILENNIQFLTGLSICEDIIFGIMTAVLAKNISYTDENLLLYRINRKNASSNSRDLIYFEIFQQYDYLQKFFQQNGLYDKFRVEFIKDAIYTLIYYLQEIKPSLKKDFYKKMQTYFRKYYKEEFGTTEQIRQFDTMTYYVIHKVVSNSYFRYRVITCLDRIFSLRPWIGGKNIIIFSKFVFWVNNKS